MSFEEKNVKLDIILLGQISENQKIVIGWFVSCSLSLWTRGRCLKRETAGTRDDGRADKCPALFLICGTWICVWRERRKGTVHGEEAGKLEK